MHILTIILLNLRHSLMSGMEVLFIVGKNDYMMKFFDYIFFRIYNYLDLKFQKYPNVPNPADWYAFSIFILLFMMPLCCVLAAAQHWIDIPIKGREEWRIFHLSIGLPFVYRYGLSERVKKGNYEMFRKNGGMNLPISVVEIVG